MEELSQVAQRIGAAMYSSSAKASEDESEDKSSSAEASGDKKGKDEPIEGEFEEKK
jgi:hypothetical protein